MQDSIKAISASLLRLRMKSPFFATLALFARFLPTQQLPTLATDGKDIFFNPNFLRSLPPAQQDAVLLHEVLHAALLHVVRRGNREAQIWNIAADIVVNGMIIQQGCFELPPDALRDPKLEHLSVEEIYELLLQQAIAQPSLSNPDLLDQPPADCQENAPSQNDSRLQQSAAPDQSQHRDGFGADSNTHSASAQFAQPNSSSGVVSTRPIDSTNNGSLAESRRATLEAHWRNAMQQATAMARTVNQGHLPLGLDRELAALDTAQLDWRSYLWRYLVQTPTDFMGFDRRFVGRRIYLESLVGESVRVYVAVDTSASISTEQLRLFLGEVYGILGAYPHLQCDLYYTDAEAYGPYSLASNADLPAPKGGGGTSFVPFFQQVAEQWDGMNTGVCVYLTDGYGQFPLETPCLPVLWVVTPGGLTLEQFPFGEAVRLLSS